VDFLFNGFEQLYLTFLAVVVILNSCSSVSCPCTFSIKCVNFCQKVCIFGVAIVNRGAVIILV